MKCVEGTPIFDVARADEVVVNPPKPVFGPREHGAEPRAVSPAGSPTP